MTVRFDPTRRDVLAGSVAALGACVAGLPSPIARAASGVHSFSLGSMELMVLSDGVLNMPTRLLNRDMEPAKIEAALGGALSAPGQVQFGVNITLVRRGQELILIDAGAGSTWEPTVGKLADRLAAAGIDPKNVTKVVVTHGHPDHIWGLVDDFDELRFPNADHIMPAAELDYWRQVDVATLHGRMQGVAAGAKRVIGEIGERLSAASAETELLPGVSYISTPGHTPGHCSVRLTSGSHGLIVAADTVFHPVVSFAYPGWQPASDMDAALAAASRRRLLDIAATDKLQMIAYHIPFPGLGRVERHAGAYLWRS
jgi:glyoxylase-like metal-dependent hydrolase (beta-lactamase superfamily II)